MRAPLSHDSMRFRNSLVIASVLAVAIDPARTAAANVASAAAAVTHTLALVAAPTVGTAFAVRTGEGWTAFLTAAHVVGCRTETPCAPGGHVTVYLDGALRDPIVGSVVAIGRATRTDDLAVFTIPRGPLPTVSFGSVVSVGETAAVLGYPATTLDALQDSTLEATAGAVLSIGSVASDSDGVLSGSFATFEGDSGGPVFIPDSGAVVGVVHGMAPGGRTYLAVGLAPIQRFLSAALAQLDEHSSQPDIGAAEAQSPPPPDASADDLYAYALRVRSSDSGAYVRYLRLAAEAGNGLAADALGAAYNRGEGIPADAQLAQTWYARAVPLLEVMAGNGNGAADYQLGWMEQLSELPSATPALALQYYERGAEVGDRDCIVALANAYATGTLTTRDPAKAAFWYFTIASKYENGDGVPKTLYEALRWYDAAAAADPNGDYGTRASAAARRLRATPP